MIALARKQVFFLILIGLFIVSSVFLWLNSLLISPQITMDAAYYHIMVDQLENGKGFTEPFIWHFLNDYHSIEHPMDYWMPLGIVLYYIARLCCGVAGEIWLNILIWSTLSILVYIEVLRVAKSIVASAFAWLTMLFCGRYLFYLLTTDNIVFYALLGFFYFKFLGYKKSRWHVTAAIGGLCTLTRIEGILIALFGGLCELYRTRSFKVIIGYTFVLMLVLSPWLVRNYRVFEHPWPSNSKALLLRQYDDMFNRNAAINIDNYWKLGLHTIVKQKLNGLWYSMLNLVAAPGLLIMYPIWLAGLIQLWNRGGNVFTLLLILFWFFCGILIPLQAEKGSALHISAFFSPYYAILGGVGISQIKNRYHVSQKICLLLTSIILFWLMFASYYSMSALAKGYAADNESYEALFAQTNLENRKIVSALPVKVYLETKSQGVISSSYNASEPLELAEIFACDTIIMDRRASGYKPLPEMQDWKLLASNTYLSVFIRANTYNGRR